MSIFTTVGPQGSQYGLPAVMLAPPSSFYWVSGSIFEASLHSLQTLKVALPFLSTQLPISRIRRKSFLGRHNWSRAWIPCPRVCSLERALSLLHRCAAYARQLAHYTLHFALHCTFTMLADLFTHSRRRSVASGQAMPSRSADLTQVSLAPPALPSRQVKIQNWHQKLRND